MSNVPETNVDKSYAKRELQKDFERFLEFFVLATAMVGEDYMQLPVAGQKDRAYRERVYCYELYHCLRSVIGESYESFPYSLCGELDKSGHPYIRGNILDRTKPDFLVHKPLSMGLNLVVIEVKPVVRIGRDGTRRSIRRNEISKDLKHLTAFQRLGQYHRGIYLIYGDDDDHFQRIRNKAVALSSQLGGGQVNLDLIDLYLHRESGQQAERWAWP